MDYSETKSFSVLSFRKGDLFADSASPCLTITAIVNTEKSKGRTTIQDDSGTEGVEEA